MRVGLFETVIEIESEAATKPGHAPFRCSLFLTVKRCPGVAPGFVGHYEFIMLWD